MPPKIDPNVIKYINIKVFGGEAGPASTLAPQLGPLGLNAKKVGEDIIKETTKWKGIRVMVQLKCQNKQAEITIKNTTSALIIKELGNKERDRKKVKNPVHNQNISFDAILKIAKVNQAENKSLSQEFAGTVKQVLGTAHSIGCTVDKKHPKELIEQIRNGSLNVE